MQRQLLWINRDSSSGPAWRSSTAQRSAVQSRVQRGRPRKRTSNQRPSQDVNIKSLSELPDINEQPKELYDRVARAMAAAPDPFDTLVTPIDRVAHGLLRYYVYHYHPSQWPNEPIVPGKGPYAFKVSIDRILKTAMGDALLLSCLLFSAACRLQYVDGFTSRSMANRENVYVHQALQMMQLRVQEMHNFQGFALDALLQCILFLMSAESYRNDFDASNTHRIAVLTLLRQNPGGIAELKDKQLQGSILMGDLFLACVNNKPCLYDCSYDPGAASVLRLQDFEMPELREECHLLGTSFARASMDLVPAKLQEIISQVLETYRVKTTSNIALMLPSRAFEVGQWITKRNMAIRQRLLAMEIADSRMDALRTVLIMWTLLAMNITGRIKTVKIMARRLTEVMRTISASQWAEQQNIRLWVLLVGYSCSAEESDSAVWFASEISLSETFHNLYLDAMVSGRTLADALENFQRTFLYHGPVQRRSIEKLATECHKSLS